MNFLLCGKADAKPVLLIHGMAMTAENCYGKTARTLAKKYRVILACLDGHDPRTGSVFDSIDKCCEQIERYVNKRFGGKVYAVSGFSLGGTVALALMQRGKIKAEKLHLDGALCTSLGIIKIPCKLMMTKGVGYMQKGHKLPHILLDKVFGQDSKGLSEQLYTFVEPETVEKACDAFYGFKPKAALKSCTSDVQFWCGSIETYQKKSARKLEEYLPEMRVRVFKDLGHGQMLREHSRAYIRELKGFLADKQSGLTK